ncbi:MAG: response regulator transcription factor [Coriobacteriia bacterium]|nr:response regulator transcription factor [Coriobacteriia bacterium]
MADQPMRLLVVDDEHAITEFVSYNLKREGYEVDVAHDGTTALEMASTDNYDLIILDVMLPGMSGFDVCQRLRQTSTVPVLFLSARDTEIDKVVGLEIGGDDYLAKPFGVKELNARIKALLRRAQMRTRKTTESQVIEVAGITLDDAGHRALSSKGEIELTPREYELLSCLMRNAGKVLSRDDLLQDAWGWEYLVETKTVDTHVKRLRDKLEASGVDPGLVETVRGYGYRFKADE